jgi:AraC-like DNA-binding protein
MQAEWTNYFREPQWHDLEVLHARFVDHRFSRHSHDYYVIGYVEAGVQAYTYRGVRHYTPAGQIFFVNPGEIHTGEAATPAGYIYRTMYPRGGLMEQVTEDVTGRATLPFLKEAVVRDRILAQHLRAFHLALARDESRVIVESLLLSSLAYLITNHADPQPRCRPVGRERDCVRRARDYIEAHCGENVSLSQLTAVVGLSPFYFARAFERETGLPPHAYLETVRIRKARELLDRGKPIVEVSLAVGYSDQSHFTNRFKRALGITPGCYIRAKLSKPETHGIFDAAATD